MKKIEKKRGRQRNADKEGLNYEIVKKDIDYGNISQIQLFQERKQKGKREQKNPPKNNRQKKNI